MVWVQYKFEAKDDIGSYFSKVSCLSQIWLSQTVYRKFNTPSSQHTATIIASNIFFQQHKACTFWKLQGEFPKLSKMIRLVRTLVQNFHQSSKEKSEAGSPKAQFLVRVSLPKWFFRPPLCVPTPTTFSNLCSGVMILCVKLSHYKFIKISNSPVTLLHKMCMLSIRFGLPF